MVRIRLVLAVQLLVGLTFSGGTEHKRLPPVSLSSALVARPVSLAASRSAPLPLLAPPPPVAPVVVPIVPAPVVPLSDTVTRAASAPALSLVVSIALSRVGSRYVYGATGPNAFDCSGFVFWVFNAAGIKVPRLTSSGYYSRYPHVSRSELAPGDVVVYSDHIAIYIGDGKIVAASTPRGGVKVEGVNAPGHPYGYARL